MTILEEARQKLRTVFQEGSKEISQFISLEKNKRTYSYKDDRYFAELVVESNLFQINYKLIKFEIDGKQYTDIEIQKATNKKVRFLKKKIMEVVMKEKFGFLMKMTL